MYMAIGWTALLFVGWIMAVIACGVAGASLLAKDTAMLAFEAGLGMVLLVWFALTGLDLLFRGPARRKIRAK